MTKPGYPTLEQALANIDAACGSVSCNREGHVALQRSIEVVREACAPTAPPDTDEPITGTVEPEG